MTATRTAQPRNRKDLLNIPLVGRFLRWKHSRTAIQIPMFVLAMLVLYDGFFGPQLAPKNLAGVLPWVHWRGFLVLGLLILGNVFCMACPFMLPRRMAKKLLPASRAWPARLSGKWLAVGLLATFFWAYEAFDLWASPWLTAWVIVAYFTAAFVIDGFFKGAAFCKYVCPIGQFNFVNSLASPVEVAIRNPTTCTTCQTKDCISGRHDASGKVIQNGCELWLFQPRKAGNMDCTFCLDCLHACPHDNVGLLVRHPLNTEFSEDPLRSGIGRFSARRDLAALVLVVVFGAYLNAFGMVGPVYDLERWLADILGVTHEWPVLALLFGAGILVLPIALVAAAAWGTKRLTGDPGPIVQIATHYAFALAPMGFGMWIAHYQFHFLTGALTIVPLTQEFLLDFGISALGQPRSDLAAVISEAWISRLEVFVLGLGFLGSCAAALRIADVREEYEDDVRRAAAPWIGLTVLLLLAAIWLMAQPMEMRGLTFN